MNSISTFRRFFCIVPCLIHDFTYIKAKIEALHEAGKVVRSDILLSTEEYALYYELAISPPEGEKPIGKGEAAALVSQSEQRDCRKQ